MKYLHILSISLILFPLGGQASLAEQAEQLPEHHNAAEYRTLQLPLQTGGKNLYIDDLQNDDDHGEETSLLPSSDDHRSADRHTDDDK